MYEEMCAWKWIEGKLCTVIVDDDGQERYEPITGLTFRERFKPGETTIPWDEESEAAHPDYPEDHKMAALLSKGTGKSSKDHNRGVSSASGMVTGDGAAAADDEKKDEEHDVKGGEKEEKEAEADEGKEEDPEPPDESQLR